MMGESCDVAARHSRSYQGPGRILCSREAFWLRCCFCFSTLVQRRFSPKMLSRARAYRAPSLFAKALQLRRRSLAACVQAIQLGSSAKKAAGTRSNCPTAQGAMLARPGLSSSDGAANPSERKTVGEGKRG